MNPLALLRNPRQQLPEYSVRVSSRTRKMWLRVSRWGRIEVVVPKRHSARAITEFVAENREWIKRALADFKREYGAAPRMVLPTRIVLRATGQTWTVQVRKRPGPPSLKEHPDNCLVLTMDHVDPAVWAPLLRRWLQHHAREELVPWLQAVASELGSRVRRVQVRGQRTRWGSCSDRGTISINYSLLFLPPRLVRYLFIHELCHLRCMDHSPRFWALVAEHSPNWKRLDRDLHNGRRLVPDWLELI